MSSLKTRELLEADYFDLLHLYPTFRKTLLDETVRSLKGKQIAKNRVAEVIAGLGQFHEFEQLPTLSRISVAELSTYLQNTLLRDTDQMSMAHALEVRVPFLDHELVEYVMQVSDRIKYPHRPKQLLTDSFADLLPREIIDRPKMGFVLPWEDWMRGPLKSFAEEGIHRMVSANLLEADGVHQLWQAFLKGDPAVSWSRVWPLITLAAWMEENNIE